MSYLRQQHKGRSFGRSEQPARFIPLPPKQRMAPPTVQHGEKLHFPLRKDLLVPQLTLREIAWTIIDWQSRLDRHEVQQEAFNLYGSQRLSALEKDRVVDLIKKLRDEEIRNQIVYYC
jgi:hypothetical protein